MDVRPGFDLSDRNTFGLASRARLGGLVTSVDDLVELARGAASTGLALRVLGGGSNVLLRPRIDKMVAVMAMKGRSVDEHRDGSILVTAQAGEDWPAFVEWTVGEGLGGLENLAGIPGTVGAAPVQNIGAYGLELSDRLHALTAYDLVDGKIRTFGLDTCGFSYRQSLFKATDRYVILDVTLALPRPWRPVLTYRGLDSLSPDSRPDAVMARVLALRAAKLPDWRNLGNAGSFFHNPVLDAGVATRIEDAPRYVQADGRVKLSAGWLIETCGLKGAREGGAGVHASHALILVNHGGAAFDDVERLASTVRMAVMERFGIALVQEPVTV